MFAHAARSPTSVVPWQKKDILAWDNAKHELGDDQPVGALRLLVHQVNDVTTVEYHREVRRLLECVHERRLPFGTPELIDATTSGELERLCYIERASLGRGQKLLHGLSHVFPELKGKIPNTS